MPRPLVLRQAEAATAEREAREEAERQQREEEVRAPPPQHGLSSNKMALITSDCGEI